MANYRYDDTFKVEAFHEDGYVIRWTGKGYDLNEVLCSNRTDPMVHEIKVYMKTLKHGFVLVKTDRRAK